MVEIRNEGFSDELYLSKSERVTAAGNSKLLTTKQKEVVIEQLKKDNEWVKTALMNIEIEVHNEDWPKVDDLWRSLGANVENNLVK